jgi:hypothetical protein
MATQTQIEANRRNAEHSTGPRTAEGKAASSMNALKSGIDAGSSIIPGEDAAVLAALTERLYQDCQPQTVIESILVDNIVRASWRLRRFDRIDAELLIHAIEDTNYPSPNGPVGKAFDNTSTTQSRLQRRINDTSRLQREAIQDLQRLQAARPQPPTPQPAPQPTDIESSTSPNGFVPPTLIMQWPQVPWQGPEAQPFSPQDRASGIHASEPCGVTLASCPAGLPSA